MTATLSIKLQSAVAASGDDPVRVIDPRTQRVYVLIASEQYDRLTAFWDLSPVSLEEQEQAIRDAGARAGWDDPAMDVYDHYDEHFPPS